MADIETIIKNNVAKLINKQMLLFPISEQHFSQDYIPFTNFRHYNLEVTNGHITSSITKLNSCDEKTKDQYYHLEALTSLDAAYNNWIEDFVELINPYDGPHIHNNLQGFSVSIKKLDTVFDINFTNDSFSISNLTSTPNDISFHLPENSALSGNLSCVQEKINERIYDSIKNIDFAGEIKKELDKLLKDHN